MNREFLDLYSQELDHIRQMAAEFAREFPKIAGRLSLPDDSRESCADPFVERLLEGFAYFSARVQYKVEAEFPMFTEALMESVYPDFLAPTPSATVVAIEPNLNEVDPATGFQIPRQSSLRSQLPPGATVPCTFRTAHNVQLWPLQLTEAAFHTRDVSSLRLPASSSAPGVLRIRLETPPGTEVGELGADYLTFFIRGTGDFPGLVYEGLMTHCDEAWVAEPGEKPRRVPGFRGVEPVGFRPDESMFPITPRGFEGYRILREYFMLPARALFFRVNGLQGVLPALTGNQLDLLLPHREADLRLEERVDASAFRLFCTPALNLFERNCDRVLLKGQSHEHHLVVDKTRPLEFEVFTVTRLTAIDVEHDSEQPFAPFYESHDGVQSNAFYGVRRRERQRSAREKEFYTGRTYLGTEVYLTLSDSDQPPHDPRYEQLSVRALCTNRHLPMLMPRGGGSDFDLEFGAPVNAVRCLLKPSDPVAPPAEGRRNWKFINHLSANYFSFLTEEGDEGADVLRRMLGLYASDTDLQAKKEVGGIVGLAAKPVIRRMASGGGPVAMARGFEVRLILRESAFEGSSAFCLASVVEQFLARAVSINSFVEVVLETDQRGAVHRWPPRSGTRHLA